MDIHPGMKLVLFFILLRHKNRVTTTAYADAVGPYHLNHHVNFPCGRKPEYPEKTHDLRQSVDLYSFHTRIWFGSH